MQNYPRLVSDGDVTIRQESIQVWICFLFNECINYSCPRRIRLHFVPTLEIKRFYYLDC